MLYKTILKICLYFTQVCPAAVPNVLNNTTGQSTNMEQEQDFIRPRGDSLQSRFHRERARMISGMLGTPFSHNMERLSVLYEPYEGVLASGKLNLLIQNHCTLASQ